MEGSCENTHNRNSAGLCISLEPTPWSPDRFPVRDICGAAHLESTMNQNCRCCCHGSDHSSTQISIATGDFTATDPPDCGERDREGQGGCCSNTSCDGLISSMDDNDRQQKQQGGGNVSSGTGDRCNMSRPALVQSRGSKLNSPKGAVRFDMAQNGVSEKGKAKVGVGECNNNSCSNNSNNNNSSSSNYNLGAMNLSGNAAKQRGRPWGISKLTRQMSLGTGYSVLNRGENGGPKRPNVLPRSGGSFGGFSNGRIGAMAKEDYSLFRTKSGLDKQLSARMDDMQNLGPALGYQEPGNAEAVSAGRYFDALKGPELDVLRDSEDILLPLDEKWPFLLRFPIGCFGMCLGLSSQAILWKTLASTRSMKFLNVTPVVNIVLWCLALSALVVIFFTYCLKCVFYFEAVKREYYHPVRVNFFFAPWIVCMFLTIGVPPVITETIHPSLWCVFMAPVFALELKIYGQWLSGGKRRLSKVANPSSHLSVVGNFVGAILAARVDWKEPAKFFWSVGLAHYLVLFVTLYQRLPTSEALPQELHPVFFLFIAAPCTASVAWEAIHGKFDSVSRLTYFVALFLYTSLVVRVNFFRGFRFSVAWWAYTFPMTAASVATIRYSNQVTSHFTQGLALVLSFISSATVCTLCVATFLHAFVWDSLFPNDLAIAITHKRKKSKAMKEMNKIKPANFDMEQRTAPIRLSMDMLRSSLKKQHAKLLQRKEAVYPDSSQHF